MGHEIDNLRLREIIELCGRVGSEAGASCFRAARRPTLLQTARHPFFFDKNRVNPRLTSQGHEQRSESVIVLEHV